MMITTAQAAKRLKLSLHVVQNRIKSGILPAQPFGKSWMIDDKDLPLAKNARKAGRPAKEQE